MADLSVQLGRCRTVLAVALGLALAPTLAEAEEAIEPGSVVTVPATTPVSTTALSTPLAIGLDGPSSAYPNGTFSEQLASASQGGGGPVGGSGYRTGPGRRDNWKVGPHWRATVDGVLLFRDDADLDAMLTQVGPLPPSSALPSLEFRDNFDHAAGVRALLTSEFPQCAGYELQIGYVGVEKWLANAYYELETIAAASIPTSDVDVMQRRSLNYESNLHAVEINFQRDTRGFLKPFAGLRYLGLDETISDDNVQFTTGVLPDPVNVGDTIASDVTSTQTAVDIQNNLIGFQTGLRLDMWRPTRKLHFNGFVSAGAYCNIVDRDRIFQETNTVTTNERVSVSDGSGGFTEQVNTTVNTATTRSTVSGDGARVAFVTEAALAGTWKLNSCTALRAGYQVMFLSGVELSEDLWLAPPPVEAIEDDLFLHGWFAGLEYRR